MRAIILFCVLVIAFGQSPDGITISGANFQTQGVTTALQLTTRDKINAIGITNWLCHLATTKIIIGYQQGYGYGYQQRTPVYETQCAGMCLSIIDRPMSCQPRYKTILVYTDGYSYETKKVQVIVSCGCLGQQCIVVNKDTQMITTYPSGAVAYDSCERKCTCSYGKLIDCCRPRKEFRSGMTEAERERYINTVLIASTTLPYMTQYKSLIQLHQTYFSSGIHGVPVFFPWHRLFILKLEDLLQKIDCRVTVPYWDWNLEAVNPWSSTVWNSVGGVGGNGVGPSYCVTTGPFAWPGWSLPVSGGCLKRNFLPSATLGTVADVQAFITANPNPTDYDTFRTDIESGPGMHDAFHCAVGGTMCSVIAAEDPLFFLHHANIDKMWADWQAVNPSHVFAYLGSLTAPMPGVGSSVPNDVMDLNAQYNAQNGETVRICYVNPPNFGWIGPVLGSLSLQNLYALPTIPIMSSSIPWLQLMQSYMPNMITNKTIAQQELDENIRNNLVPNPSGVQYNIINMTDALNCHCITSLLGVVLSDDVLAPINNRLVAEGCPSDVLSVNPMTMDQATNVECVQQQNLG